MKFRKHHARIVAVAEAREQSEFILLDEEIADRVARTHTVTVYPRHVRNTGEKWWCEHHRMRFPKREYEGSRTVRDGSLQHYLQSDDEVAAASRRARVRSTALPAERNAERSDFVRPSGATVISMRTA